MTNTPPLKANLNSNAIMGALPKKSSNPWKSIHFPNPKSWERLYTFIPYGNPISTLQIKGAFRRPQPSQLFIVAQMWEQGSPLALVATLLLGLQYYIFKTLAQGASFSVWNLQLSLERRAIFFPLADCNPSPPFLFRLYNLIPTNPVNLLGSFRRTPQEISIQSI